MHQSKNQSSLDVATHDPLLLVILIAGYLRGCLCNKDNHHNIHAPTNKHILHTPMRPSDLVLLLACFMFSTITRAFRSATPLYARSSWSRALSSTTGAPDTSIVDICQQKIQTALNADSVKVTGE